MNAALYLRFMKHHRDESKVKHNAQQPCQSPIFASGVGVIQQQMQGSIRQKDNPYDMIQTVDDFYLLKRNKKTVLIHQCHDEKGGHHIRNDIHPFQQLFNIWPYQLLAINEKFV